MIELMDKFLSDNCEVLYECIIGGRPIVKKNTKRFARGKVYYSEKFKIWESSALSELPAIRDTITEPAILQLGFLFKDRQGEPDVSNLVEGVQDVLQKAEIIKDDKLFHHIYAYKLFGVAPCTRVRILSPKRT